MRMLAPYVFGTAFALLVAFTVADALQPAFATVAAAITSAAH